MNRLFKIFITFLFTLILFSCKDRTAEWLERTPIFRVIPPENVENGVILIDGKSQTITFSVLATGAWSTEISNSLYSFLPASGGTGKTTVSLIAPSNESGSIREALCSFIFEDGQSVDFNLEQEIQLPFLEINLHEKVVLGDGEEFVVEVNTNQVAWTYSIDNISPWISFKDKTETSVTVVIDENTSGTKRTADVKFYAVEAPELMDYLAITQNVPAMAPVADLLDVIFNADGSATDASVMSMIVDKSRLDLDCSTVYLEKYGRYAAKFNNPTIARSGLSSGYYMIPYTTDSTFGQKLADGYTYELVFTTYYDPTGLAQVKPFSSTQAGGTGMCFRANVGEINFETHVGGGWKQLYSGVIPVKNKYYHVVGVWDKEKEVAYLYVNGVLTTSTNASGNFQFMTTNVNKRWFGIGADPSGNDTGEASFYGEVVIARLYDRPIDAEEVYALYKLIK